MLKWRNEDFFSKQNDHKKYLKIKNLQSQNNKFFPFKFHHFENSIEKKSKF